jgi:hypothetical protein
MLLSSTHRTPWWWCLRACVQPGSATMKADPKESLAYFEKVNQ